VTAKTPRRIAQEILREWCAENGLALDPLVATDLVSRIETEITFDRMNYPAVMD